MAKVRQKARTKSKSANAPSRCNPRWKQSTCRSRRKNRAGSNSLPRVERVEGEIVDQNNRAARQVNIIDDYLRLMYVAYEPTWEWRFIKEVFHRDKLVGMAGFRTFLASCDPRVRESNVLFLPTLTPKRSEFFANDVIFLDDMPRSLLNDRFCEMVKEFVGNLGGGLVVIAGPRFGPKELYQTPLADMLPVIIDPNAELRDAPQHPEFRLRLTPHASRYQFMQLGRAMWRIPKPGTTSASCRGISRLPCCTSRRSSLAEHPTDKCADGKTPQPLIAIRQYGKGEVVYLGFNETWRLRRMYGEKYYRQFWSQMIYRLGMSHALGSDKRFVARLDQPQYRAEDKVTLTVEAYDENYEPLSDENLPERGLEGGTDHSRQRRRREPGRFRFPCSAAACSKRAFRSSPSANTACA